MKNPIGRVVFYKKRLSKTETPLQVREALTFPQTKKRVIRPLDLCVFVYLSCCIFFAAHEHCCM